MVSGGAHIHRRISRAAIFGGVSAQAKLQRTKDQAIQTAKNTADTTAAATSKSAFGAFAVLLLGAIAAATGGSLAVQRRLQAVAHGVVR
jgi:hypothetical protein